MVASVKFISTQCSRKLCYGKYIYVFMGKGTIKEIKNKKNNPSHFKSGFICQNKKTDLKSEF